MSTAPTEPSAVATINCPRCAAPMLSGTATVRGEALSLFFAGFSMQHLYFEFHEGDMTKKRIILQSNQSCPSYYCQKCHAFMIDNGKPEYG